MPATDLKNGTFVLIPNFNTQKGISKKLKPLRKGLYQIIDKPTEVTYKNEKKEIVQQRNNLIPYYPKEYALRELPQLFLFTGLHIVQNNPQIEQNQNVNTTKNTKTIQQQNIDRQRSNTPQPKIPQKERKNRKLTKQFLSQDQQQKSEQRESSRLRSQPRKNYKTFIPQSEILKKVEFQKQL